MMSPTESASNAAAPATAEAAPSSTCMVTPMSPIRGTGVPIRQIHGHPLSPHVTTSNNHSYLLPGSGRSRSRSVGQQPLGWSPKRVGPLSPSARGGKPVIPGLPDISLNASASLMAPMGLPPEPPVISETQKAMEAAVQKERERAKAMEKDEENLSADELRTILKRERHRMARLAADLASMRSMAVQSVAQAEVCEEGRINNLMRRLEGLQQEKGRIIVELEREEEMLTNNLQKKLNEVRREKELLEKQQMSRTDLEARLAALKKGVGGDVDMSEALEEKEEMEEEDA